MKFIFRTAFYTAALLMIYIMFNDHVATEFPNSTRRGPPPLIYGGELQPYTPYQNPSGNVESLLNNPELLYDMIITYLGATRRNSGRLPLRDPGIFIGPESVAPAGQPADDTIALPRSLFYNYRSSAETAPPEIPPGPAETGRDEREPAAELKLLGTVSGPHGNLALINNQIWAEGDWVSGNTIVRIHSMKVLLRDRGGRLFTIGM